MNGSDFNSTTPARGLTSLRIIWVALLIGELTFFCITFIVVLPQKLPQSQQPSFDFVALGMLVTVIPISFLIRRLILRRGGASGPQYARAQSSANIVFWAGCDSVCFFGLLAAMLGSWTWPVITTACVPVALQLLTFPRSSAGR